LDRIADVVQKIQKDSKIGTAYERYDITYLWDLGEQIRLYSAFATDKSDVVAEVMDYLTRRSIRCLPLLLKNAETTRRVWTRREDFLQFAKDASYGKLREVLPILDPEFVSQHKVAKGDLDNLGRTLAGSTYEEVLEHIRKLRDKYDPSRQSVDQDSFYQELYSAIEDLRQLVEKPNLRALTEFREKFGPKLIQDSRRLLAAMKNEGSFDRLAKELPREFGRDLDTKTEDLDGHLFRVIYNLSRIRNAPVAVRENLRERIGMARLGELSTLMKAASNDEEMERYLRGQKLLQQIRLPEMKG
jgi:hypothetical protein